MSYITVSKEVDIDIDLEDFDTDELVSELARRGTGAPECDDGKEVLQSIYVKRRSGQDYQADLDKLIWLGLGRVL
jgi:hypothetical protein